MATYVKCPRCGTFKFNRATQLCENGDCGNAPSAARATGEMHAPTGLTTKIGALEVMRKDLGGRSWHDATRACLALGGGWRLPTRAELAKLYENKEAIGGFATGEYDAYWTCENYAATSAWVRSFADGNEDTTDKGSGGKYEYARAVRTVTSESTSAARTSGAAEGTFECSRCHETLSHSRITDQYAGNLWVCPGCAYKTPRYD